MNGRRYRKGPHRYKRGNVFLVALPDHVRVERVRSSYLSTELIAVFSGPGDVRRARKWIDEGCP